MVTYADTLTYFIKPFSDLYHDALFADLYSEHGRPVEVAPWRLNASK